MSQTAVDDRYFQTERVWKILLRIAPPVMLAQLIQALYNIVDSYFVGQYSNSGLTALSVIFPVQLIITAIAVGTGVGVNTYMARMYAFGKKRGGRLHGRDGNGAGSHQLGSVCSGGASADGALCAHLRDLFGCGSRCGALWKHRVCGEPGDLSGEHLDQGTPGGRQYASAHAGPDRRSADQHRAGPHPDFWAGSCSAHGDRGSGHRHGGGPVCGGGHYGDFRASAARPSRW